MKFLYNLGIWIYSAFVHIFSAFDSRAALLVKGRKMWRETISEKLKPGDKVIWIHCASLGEFEQGRPVIEAIRKNLPSYKILLTFFSPSGYEIRKNYDKADCITYLPSDTRRNAMAFINMINPSLVIFVKYEFWNNYISALHSKNIPLYLISGIFRGDQHFFKWYGAFFREMLKKFEKIYLQDKQSFELLSGIGMRNILIAGDTRFDRVMEIAAQAKDIPVIEKFRGEERLFLAGSSWKQDEEIISEYLNNYPLRMKWVFAPHMIDKPNIQRIEKLFKVKSVRFSEYNDSSSDARVLIIDNIGMLSSAYRYAYVAEIGGGFGKGIHNILEAACWGVPVLFGPVHENFKEAVDLKKEGGALVFSSYEEFRKYLDYWLDDVTEYKTSSETMTRYIKENAGATEIIIAEIIRKILTIDRS
jgi:3-deoxy-D-manno-octulosonic-acid transferase